MKRLTILGILALVVFLAPVAVIAASAPSGILGDVTVTNQPSNPVPVTLEGTGTVSGSVEITNTPDVNVVNTPSVKNSDDPARHPYQNSFSLQINAGASKTNQSFDPNIPAGMRLAVDHVNVLGELPVGQHLIGVSIAAFVNNSAAGNSVGTTFRGTSPSGVVFNGPLDIFSGDSGPGLFVDPGAGNIELSAFRDATVGLSHVFVQFYGHLVSVP